MKTTAHAAVIFPKKVVGPALPKRVWLEAPPRDAPILAPFPACKRTTMMRTILTMICNTTTAVNILPPKPNYYIAMRDNYQYVFMDYRETIGAGI
jgi:hypothetical protein